MTDSTEVCRGSNLIKRASQA